MSKDTKHQILVIAFGMAFASLFVAMGRAEVVI